MHDRVQERVIVINASKVLGTGFILGAFGLWHAPKIHSFVRTVKLMRRGW